MDEEFVIGFQRNFQKEKLNNFGVGRMLEFYLLIYILTDNKKYL